MKNSIIQLLREEMKPAVGCTEPAALSLAAAIARKEAPGELKEIKIRVNPGIYKNAKSVGIPGVEKTGVEMAVALGLAMAEPVYNLEILANNSKKDEETALKILEKVPLILEVDYSQKSLYLELEVKTQKGKARVLVINDHSNLVLLERDGEILLDRRKEVEDTASTNFLLKYPLADVISEFLTIPSNQMSFLLKGI